MKQFIVIVMLASGALQASAQKLFGGFGQFTGGLYFPIAGDMKDRLSGNNLLGSGFNWVQPGSCFGGQGFGVINNVLIGGGGYGASMTGDNAGGKATISSGGGFFNLGYMFKTGKRGLLYPYVGIGGGGSDLLVSNTSGSPMEFAPGQVIPPGERRRVISGSGAYEVGIGFMRTVIGEGYSGFTIGAQIGYSSMMGSNWEYDNNGQQVSGLGNLSGAYFRITLGGGGIYESK